MRGHRSAVLADRGEPVLWNLWTLLVRLNQCHMGAHRFPQFEACIERGSHECGVEKGAVGKLHDHTQVTDISETGLDPHNRRILKI